MRYGYLQTSESSTLVVILKELNVSGCETVAECKKKASDAIDCTYNVNTRNENSDCDIGSLFLPDDRTTETVYTSSDLGTSSPIPINAYTPNTTTCNVEQDTTKNTIDECKTHLIQQLYRNSGPYTRNDFIFGHFSGTSCKLYKCTKTTFLENKAEGEGQDGQLIPLKPVQNKTVIIEVLQAGNSNVNPLALACPVNYEATCTACQGGWSIGNAARDAWTDIDASKQNPANPQNWGQCSETSVRKRDSTDTQSYCDATQTKPCQLVDVTSASFDKTNGQLTVTWDNSTATDYPSGQYLTIKHGNAYETIIDGSSEKVIASATPPDIHLYRSDTSGNDLGDKTVRVCAQHVANYNAYPVTVSPGCIDASSKERQLKPITSECVVDETSSYGACQDRGDNDKQYKNLLQIKLPYDGSDPYAGCDNEVSKPCYVCQEGYGNQGDTGDVTKECVICPVGTESSELSAMNARECVACDGVSYYQDQTGQTSCNAITTCFDGNYITQNASSIQNRVCAQCEAGTFTNSQNSYECQTCDGVNGYQDQTGQTSCKTVSSCPVGQGVTQIATTISNTQCEVCDGVNTYSDENSKTQGCKEIKKCPAGYRLSGHSNSHEGTCVACGEGTFISATEHRITSCTPHTTCVDGEYVTQNPSSTQNRVCQACPAGSVSSGTNQASCTACDGVNEYQDQTGQTSCEPVSSCPKGQGVTATSTPDADTVCQPCISGSTFSDENSKTATCQAVNVCDGSEAEAEPPTAQSDRECQCAAGHYVYVDVNTATESCQPCPSGTYQPSANAVETCPNTWSTCAAGTYISVEGTTTSDRTCSNICDAGNQEHSCSSDADCCSAQNYECGDSSTCVLKCSATACGGCAQALCNFPAQCVWESDQCNTCSNGDINCVDSEYYYCNSCYESVAKKSDNDVCETDIECISGVCSSGTCASLPKVFSVIEAGNGHTCGIEKNTNDLYCWGYNLYGQLGDGSTTDRNIPTKVSISNVKSVSVGDGNTCAIKNDDTLYCWGQNTRSQLGDGTTRERHSPTQVMTSGCCPRPAFIDVKQVSAGNGYTCAVKNDDKLYCWGQNNHGQLGYGNTQSKNTPSSTHVLSNVKSVSVQIMHTCAIKNDDTLYCWGKNSKGQLGDGSTNNKYSPTSSVLSNVKEVSVGSEYTIVITTSGEAYGWGSSGQGKSCRNHFCDYTGCYSNDAGGYKTPGRCISPNDLTNNQMSAAFYAFSCILQTTYQVNCFGGNYNGNMGDGSTGIEISNPGAADNVEYASSDSTVTNAIYVTVGQSHACLLDIDGYAYCWGSNWAGQLGDGTINGNTRAVAVI